MVPDSWAGPTVAPCMTADSGTSYVVRVPSIWYGPRAFTGYGLSLVEYGTMNSPLTLSCRYVKFLPVLVTRGISMIPVPLICAPLTYSNIFTYFRSFAGELSTFVGDSWTRR